MGGLLLGTDLGKGKKGSDVRDTAGEEQEVLNHQFAEGTRWRTTQQVLEFKPGWWETGISLEKVGYLGKMIHLVLDMSVLGTLAHSGGRIRQVCRIVKGTHGSENKTKVALVKLKTKYTFMKLNSLR